MKVRCQRSIRVGRAVVRWGILAIGLLLPAAAPAQLSPGELSMAHATLEGSTRCLDCHSSGQGVAPDRCLACHTALRRRAAAGVGLHARAEFRACETCHIEHHGREFQLIFWGDEGRDAFDHRRAGWPLEGAHRRQGCRQCHRPENLVDSQRLGEGGAVLETTFLGLGTTCLSCHEDEHQGRLGSSACRDCHTLESWSPAPGFDHGVTDFPLTGRHRDVSCEGCHASRQGTGGGVDSLKYSGIAHASCSNCHQDPHQGRLGQSCSTCHTTEGWRNAATTGFDHARTRFPLVGRHRQVACVRCHGGGPATRNLQFAHCADCHQDPHAGQMRSRADRGACDSCHSVEGFTPSDFGVLEHLHTAYPLVGAHLAVACNECHQTQEISTLRRLASGPISARSGQRSAVQFRFRETTCDGCHGDPHQGTTKRFAEQGCVTCHSVESWAAPVFDHAALTGFSLEGGHASVACESCHREGTRDPGGYELPRDRLVFAPVAAECSSCHGDPHREGLAVDRAASDASPTAVAATTRSCPQCHRVAAWSEVRFDHARDTGFVLEGAHERLRCQACHTMGRDGARSVLRFEPSPPTTCDGCHGVVTVTGDKRTMR